MKQGKIWGDTTVLLSTPQIEIHLINILPNSECSLHCHQQKFNAFYCLQGKVFIEVHKNSYALVDTTELESNGFTTVAPNEYHKFVTKNLAAKVLEIYYLDGINPLDIVRKNVGSTNKS
jgi:mannose-6-phosphate isomerase-like protein (cupin superfamily)